MIKIGIKPLSVNATWKGRRYKTKEYKAYERAILLSLPKFPIPNGKLKIYLEFGFSNKSSDWDNPIKPFQDILQKKYDFNDSRIYEAEVLKKIVPKGSEYVKFRLEEIK